MANPLVAAHHLAIDQAPHLEVAHGLDHEFPGDQPYAHGIAPRHEPIAVVLDLVNPVGPDGACRQGTGDRVR